MVIMDNKELYGMATSNKFFGLPMPVFTAFGWAGEEKAIEFALTQLNDFIDSLHAQLPRPVKTKFPHHGLNKANRNVYMSADEDPDANVALFFNARPMSLELQIAISGKATLAKALKQAETKPTLCHRLITELGAEWSMRLQQMELNPETGETTHYQDLFKDSVTELNQETAVAVLSKAAYLNGEEKWVTPIQISRRFSSDQASAMGSAILNVMNEEIDKLMPLIRFLTGQVKTKKKRASRKTKKTATAKSVTTSTTGLDLKTEEGFSFTSELKPLHLRRGFINMTSDHWPFFSINSRTVTRPVTVYYDGIYDKKSSVLRMVPHDIARLELSTAVHSWVEDNFVATDQIQIDAVKLDEKEIQISLKPIE